MLLDTPPSKLSYLNKNFILSLDIMVQNIPVHVAIIPDGNRRFAKKLLKKPWKGHEWGVNKLKDVLGWCRELGIKFITIYTLSLENIKKRPKREIDYLLKLAKKEMDDIIYDKAHFIHKHRVKVRFIGRLNILPESIRERIKRIEELTANSSQYFLNLAIAYGGKQEIIDAFKKFAIDIKNNGKSLDIESVDERFFRRYLYLSDMPDPDLVIRTGGEKRISNFLLFQTAYSELVFIDSMWPELSKEQFMQAIEDFATRKRRFGS